jgi:hypothetical protein
MGTVGEVIIFTIPTSSDAMNVGSARNLYLQTVRAAQAQVGANGTQGGLSAL